MKDLKLQVMGKFGAKLKSKGTKKRKHKKKTKEKEKEKVVKMTRFLGEQIPETGLKEMRKTMTSLMVSSKPKARGDGWLDLK